MDNFILALRAYKSDVEIHRHSAYQIVFTTDNPFHSTIERKKHQNIYGFVIRPHVAHACECSNSNLTIINIEPYSFIGKIVLEKLKKNNFKVFYNNDEFTNFFNISGLKFSIYNLVRSYQSNKSGVQKDERIEKVIAYINQNFQTEQFSLNDIANHVFLSPSRLGFLFKQETGSSIMKYLLWTRLRRAIFLILTNHKKRITDIALESGFYDSSQMNKYMYQMFGVGPLKLRQKSDLIQFLEIESD
ncbi:helix-turn-helix domain-containing protein [Runella zeae]|uniref:helix-turn-helix domain-containing protein n=1 Tax=Runella zeae TaxID=94255 RepID=UPI00040964C7|nr:AraC family transcriptional regulator [Runella zeae]